MYVMYSDSVMRDRMFLAWEPVTNSSFYGGRPNDNWLWVDEKILRRLANNADYNRPPHQFTFSSRDEAQRQLNSLPQFAARITYLGDNY